MSKQMLRQKIFQFMVDHFTANCTTQNTVPSHIEKPLPIYILLNKIHSIAIYLSYLVHEIWPSA